jgi:hypothetical protein
VHWQIKPFQASQQWGTSLTNKWKPRTTRLSQLSLPVQLQYLFISIQKRTGLGGYVMTSCNRRASASKLINWVLGNRNGNGGAVQASDLFLRTVERTCAMPVCQIVQTSAEPQGTRIRCTFYSALR